MKSTTPSCYVILIMILIQPARQHYYGVSSDMYGCSGTLDLTCGDNQVVGGAVYGVKGRTGDTSCPPSPEGLCLGAVGLKSADECLWKSSTCRLVLTGQTFFTGESPCGFAPDNLAAKNVQCVDRELVHDICGQPHPALGRHGYIMSPGYPLQFPTGQNCTVHFPRTHDVEISFLFADLPRVRGQCDDYHRDYVEMTSRVSHNRFCGRVDDIPGSSPIQTVFLLPAPASVRFVSRQQSRQYKGFILEYRYLRSTTNTGITPHTDIVYKGLVVVLALVTSSCLL